MGNDIKLNEFDIKCFKGAKDVVIDFNGRSAEIRGVNGAGKTTCFDAFTWVLFGKDSDGAANFEIKPIGRQEDVSVEMILEIDGKPVELKKTYAEKWTKKRGSAQAELTGHTIDHFFNGVPVQKKEFDAKISEIIHEETFKLITSPTYFNGLHWAKRRETLLSVCGDITDDEVIASDAGLKELSKILKDRNIDEQKKVIAGKKKEINRELTEIPARIDELQKAIIEGDEDEIRADIENLKKQIEAAKDDSWAAGLRKQKAELTAKLFEMQAESALLKKNAELKQMQEIVKLQRVLDEAERTVLNSDGEKMRLLNKIDGNTEEMNALRLEYRAEVAATPNDASSVCPACGQVLPEDQVQDAVEKFNLKKAKGLEGINRKGKKLKKEVEAWQEEASLLEQNKKEAIAIIEKAQNDIQTLKEEMPVVHPKDTSKIEAEIAAVEAKMGTVVAADTSGLETELGAKMEHLGAVEAQKKDHKRIIQLMAEERKLSAEFEELERQLNLIERFIVAKVTMLDEKINSKFKIARFKMFEKQINGGIVDCCETLYNNAPYSGGASSGERIFVGLDIVATLQKHYGINAPVWIDHFESLSSTPTGMECQMIFLKVSEEDKKLVVEFKN